MPLFFGERGQSLLYSNAHKAKISKAGIDSSPPPIIEDKTPFVFSKGWAEMIRKVYETYPLLCPHCGGQMRIISFITDYPVVDRIINHLKLTFVVDKPPPRIAFQELLMAAESPAEYFS